MMYCLNYRQLFATMVIAIFITVASSFAHAQLRETLSQSKPGQLILSLNPRLLTEDVRKKLAAGQFQPIADRTEEAQQAINTLIRIKGKNPVLLGEAGVGKTAVAEKISQMIVQGQIPTGKVYSQEIATAEIIQLEAASIKSLAKKPEDAALVLVETVKQLEAQLGLRKIKRDCSHTAPQEFRPEGPSEMLSAANLMFHCTWGCREISLEGVRLRLPAVVTTIDTQPGDSLPAVTL